MREEGNVVEGFFRERCYQRKLEVCVESPEQKSREGRFLYGEFYIPECNEERERERDGKRNKKLRIVETASIFHCWKLNRALIKNTCYTGIF